MLDNPRNKRDNNCPTIIVLNSPYPRSNWN